MYFRQLLTICLIGLWLPAMAYESNARLDSMQLAVDETIDKEQKYFAFIRYITELQRIDRAEAIPQLYEALIYTKEIGNADYIHNIYRLLGSNYLFINKNDSSYHYLEIAKSHFEKTNNTVRLVTIYNNIALIKQRSNEYEEATESYIHVIELGKESKNYYDAIAAYINVASLQINQENYRIAINYLKNAEQLLSEVPKDSVIQLKDIDEFLVPGMYINMGVTYDKVFQSDSLQNLKLLDTALMEYNKALKAIEKIPNEYNATYMNAYTHDNIGNVYLQLEQPNKALGNFQIAYDQFTSLQNEQGATHALADKGQALVLLKRYEEANEILHEALEKAEKAGIKEEIRNIYKALSESEKGVGNFEAALLFHEKYIKVDKEIISEERDKNLQDMETKYGTQILKQTNQINIQEKENAQQKAKTQQIIFLFSLFGILGLSFLLYNRYKYKQQKKAAEFERGMNVAMARFVPTEFIKSIGRNKITEVELGDQIEKEVTVIFTDIRNFTSRSEKMTATETFQFVKKYSEAMGPIIQRNGGFINQYLGDGVMAIFQNSPEDALSACIEMHARLVSYNKDLIGQGVEPIEVGMGLHTGPAVMGIIGDEDRRDAAMISDTVNTAARMESKTKQFGTKILISEDSRAKLEHPDHYQLRHIGDVTVKGKEKPIDIFECVNADEQESYNQKMKTLGLFNEAVEKFFEHQYEQAYKLFSELILINPKDKVSESFIAECKEYIEELPAEINPVTILAR